MKPTAERYQAATQVNVVSPEMDLIEKVNGVQESGRQHVEGGGRPLEGKCQAGGEVY